MIVPGLTAVWRGAMIVLGIAAVVPPHPATSARTRIRPTSYADAVARARALIAADDSIVAEGGATILRVHGRRAPRAIVLIHGFTDSPRQFAELADSLYALRRQRARPAPAASRRAWQECQRARALTAAGVVSAPRTTPSTSPAGSATR